MIQNFIIFMTVALFSLFSTGIMSYISLATPLGPWVAPMLALISLLLFSPFVKHKLQTQRFIIFSTVGGSIGGILATALGSSFPTLYFLNPSLFAQWMSTPLYFSCILGLISLTASLYGFILAHFFEKQLLDQQQLAFPIGQLVFGIANTIGNQTKKAVELVSGFIATLVFCLLQGGKSFLTSVIPSGITLFSPHTIAFVKTPLIQVRFDTLPMLAAIGFIAGTTIALPLAVGALSKIIILDPLNHYYFPSLSNFDFSIAFSSGLVTVSSLFGFISFPTLIKRLDKNNVKNSSTGIRLYLQNQSLDYFMISIIVCTFLLSLTFFVVFKFSILQALYLLLGTLLTTYSMTSIAGKIGLAQLGRFATFVMVPGLFLFGADAIHATVIAAFVEITGGVATDILFGQKTRALSNFSKKETMVWQLIGLLISAVAAGLFFWLLINHFGLGSTTLFAQRAQARALLINLRSFNIYVLCIGGVYGLLLKKLKLNPMLVFGGLLMPLAYSLGLIIGGFSTLLVKNSKEWEPLCSGIFAANSLAEFFKVLR